MVEKTKTTDSTYTSPPAPTANNAPVVARRAQRSAAVPHVPGQAMGSLGGSNPQLRHLQHATGNFGMAQIMAASTGRPNAVQAIPTAELTATAPDFVASAGGDETTDMTAADMMTVAPPALFTPPAPPYAPLATRTRGAPAATLMPLSLAEPSAPGGAAARTNGEVVERPPTSPAVLDQAAQTAQQRAEAAAQSAAPEFAQSVAVQPMAQVAVAAPAQPPAEADAQTEEQQANLQASEEAAGELAEEAQDLGDAEALVEEAAPAEEMAPAPGAPAVPKSADLGATAGQAFTVLATPLADTMSLSARPVQFAPRPDEGGEQTPPASFRARRKRAASETLAGAFLARNAAQAQNLVILGLTAPPRILAAAALAKGAVDAAVAQNIGAVQAQIAAVSGQVMTEVDEAITNINTQRESTQAAITTATILAQTSIEITYLATLTLLNTQEGAQLTSLENLYTTWEPKLRAVGTEVGDEAIAKAEKRAQEWLDQRNGESSILDGPIHDNRLKARADAARQVAKEYKKSLEKAANEQTDKVMEGKPVVLDAVRQATEEARTNLATHRQTLLDALAESEAGALAQVDEAAASLTQAVEAGRESYLAALAEQEVVQISRLIDYGERQKGAIDADASLAITALATSVGEAVTAFNTSLEEFAATAQATAAPDAEALQPSLAAIQMQTDMLLALLLQQLAAGIQASEAGITAGGVQSVDGVNALGQSALEQANSTGSSHTESVGALVEQATTGFTQLQSGHTDTVTTAMTNAVTGFATTSTQLTGAFTQLSENARTNFVDGQTQLRDGLRTEGLKELNTTIDTEAQKAADAVQPRWKSVVKWVITVLVVVAVIAISIATAGAGGVLGGILIGAALGGVAGATIQVGHNLVDGKKWSDGVGKAFVVGAIGGAFGGVGAAVGKAVFGEVAKGVLNAGLKFGMEAGIDVVGGIVGDLVVGNPITLEGVLFGAAIGAGVSGGLAIGGALKGKIKIKPKPEISAPKVEAPVVTAPPPKVAAPEVTAPAPKPAARAVQPPAPKAAAPEATPTSKTGAPEVEVPALKPAAPEPAPTMPKAPAPEGTPPKATPEGEPPTPKRGALEAEPKPTRKPELEPEEGITAKHKTDDGHEVKLTDEGQVVRCSTCVLARNDRVYTENRHTLNGKAVQRDLKKGKEAHVFDDAVELNDLEYKVWTAGEYHGEVRGWQRFTYTSPIPIGRRVQAGKPDVPLYVVEVKGRLRNGEWEYHLVPRSKVAAPPAESAVAGSVEAASVSTPTTKTSSAMTETAATEGAGIPASTTTAGKPGAETVEEMMGAPVTSETKQAIAEAVEQPVGKGTVWEAINAEGPALTGTSIPRYFELKAGGSEFWVHPNATKHMAEFVLRESPLPMQANMRSQLLLADFQDTVEKAVQQGVRYGEMMNIGHWELIFNQRPGDPLPVIMHALYRGG